MTKKEPEKDEEAQDVASSSAAALAAAARQAQQAIQNAKELVAQARLDEVGAKAAQAASDLYREGRDRLAGNEDLSQAAEQLSAAIRKNPLAAVGIAFSAGLLLALLTRG